jgi:hypothetical protein
MAQLELFLAIGFFIIFAMIIVAVVTKVGR